MGANVQRANAQTLWDLHHGPKILILPNAWDAVSARLFAHSGFAAIATTSSGIALTQGYPDGERIGRDEMLAVVGRIVRAVPLPVTADLEAGYGPAPEDVAETVRRAIGLGVVGANLEDSARGGATPLFERSLAVERIAAARRAARAEGLALVINARTDGFLHDRASQEVFEEAVRRGNAYLEAGADSVFVPGVSDAPTIARLAKELRGPLNILAGARTPPVSELESLGVARVSFGGGLARAALTRVRQAARELLGSGTYSFAEGTLTNADLAGLLGS